MAAGLSVGASRRLAELFVKRPRIDVLDREDDGSEGIADDHKSLNPLEDAFREGGTASAQRQERAV
jgi:hypothetical protein